MRGEQEMKIIEEKIIVEDGQEYKVKTYSNGSTVKEMVSYPVEPSIPEPSQLDRIEEMVSKSAEELRQEGAEALTLELIEGGIL